MYSEKEILNVYKLLSAEFRILICKLKSSLKIPIQNFFEYTKVKINKA